MSGRLITALVVLVAIMLGPHCANGQQGPVAPGSDEPVTLQRAFPNLTFTRPVDLQHPGDGTERLFVLEQRGVIRVFNNDPAVTEAGTFLDIEDRVNDQGNEEGLLGLAFHPEFENNGFFYVDYTAQNPRRTVIARYRVNPQNPNLADNNSETVILEIPQPYGNHNGGQIAFGPDGFLYISMGDGGSGGDPQGHGQNTSTLLGNILRIDVDNPSGGMAYGIPSDNPYVGNTSGARPEIYASGLRNAWRFSFDPETGRLWAADVGQNAYEEVNIIEKGGNYGWNIMEATHCFEPETGCNRQGLTLPVWEYPRGEGVSVTGGYVYRGQRVPALEGRYIVGDFASGKIWALTYNGSGMATAEELMDTELTISSFGVDRNNELYVLAFDGNIYRFAAGNGTP
jgi:glucose/arabinose dehydrogenase